MIHRLCLAIVAVFLIAILAIIVYATMEKTIPPKWNYGSTIYYKGLGITNDGNSWLGKRDIRVEWITVDGLFYKATSIGDDLFRFQIMLNDHVLADGITIQDNININIDYGVPFIVEHGAPYEAASVLESTNYDLNGMVICEVRNGNGQILLPRQSDAFKNRVCALYDIVKSAASKVCFLDNKMQDVDKEDLAKCVTWSH